jgi:hypothetical protein
LPRPAASSSAVQKPPNRYVADHRERVVHGRAGLAAEVGGGVEAGRGGTGAIDMAALPPIEMPTMAR